MQRMTFGELSFAVDGAALRHIRFGGVEALRGIALLSRDRDWGTITPEVRETAPLRFAMTFRNGDARLEAELVITCSDSTLTLEATGTVTGAFETNRTGFTLLHPAHVAGCRARVTHSDGTVEATQFPDLIAPWQPMMDITVLEHEANGLRTTCHLEGDTFEMEDQRQWGDASFKTYNRPLALPWPYRLDPGSRFHQRVTVRFERIAAPAQARARSNMGQTVFPDTALLLNAWDAPQVTALPIPAQRLLCHVDTNRDPAPQIAALAALQARLPAPIYDLELVCAFAKPPEVELTRIADLLTATGFQPDSTLVCPSVDRQSTPPGSDWPDCPPLEDIHRIARSLFPRNGGGIVSFFPELNRKRPPMELLDFAGHGLCPIVHAADDLHVMETLETIPHITRSARAILGDRGYRIGPCTIAMRHNPYGARTIPNPDGAHVPMADDDPRHRSAFGAAYAIGLATALAPAGVTVWTPAEMTGPRGLHPDWPITQALTLLAGLAGQQVHAAEIAHGLARLHLGTTEIRANLTDGPNSGLPAYGWTSAHNPI